MVALCETADAAAQKATEMAMTPLAEKYQDAKAAGEEDPKIAFMIGKASGGISVQLRKIMGLPSPPPAAHEHLLAEHDQNGGNWGCDGCNRGGRPAVKRFRCTEGCDFDYCEECNGKVGTTAELLPPKMMILNIPDGGAFFEGPEGDITADAVKQFVDSFEAGKLERKQLER